MQAQISTDTAQELSMRELGIAHGYRDATISMNADIADYGHGKSLAGDWDWLESKADNAFTYRVDGTQMQRQGYVNGYIKAYRYQYGLNS